VLQLACNAGADAAAQLARMVDKHRCRPHRVAPPPALQTDWRGGSAAPLWSSAFASIAERSRSEMLRFVND
jgi:hypothetical protein